MALTQDDRQWLIYDPNTVDSVLKAIEASALVMYGAWLQGMATRLPSTLADSVGTLGVVTSKIGESRQQIQAGLSVNDVPDELVAAQRALDELAKWLQDRSTPVPVGAIDELAGAMKYLDERTMDTGTNHPRWNSRIVSGQPCESCGR